MEEEARDLDRRLKQRNRDAKSALRFKLTDDKQRTLSMNAVPLINAVADAEPAKTTQPGRLLPIRSQRQSGARTPWSSLRIPVIAGLALLLSVACGFCADQDTPLIKLTGIATSATDKQALLEIQSDADTHPAGSQLNAIMREGEWISIQKGSRVELSAIDEQAGKVTVKIAGQSEVIAFRPTTGSATVVKPASMIEAKTNAAESVTLRLQAAQSDQVFGIYQQLAKRTILRAQSLPKCRLNLSTEGPVGAAELIKALDAALAEQGILMQPDRDKFICAVRKPSQDVSPDPFAQSIPAAAPVSGADDNGGMLEAGELKCLGAQLSQVLAVYQELTGRTVLDSAELPDVSITVCLQTRITRAEAIYLFDKLMALNGVAVVPFGTKFVAVVPDAQRAEASAILAHLSTKPAPSAGGFAAGAPLAAGALRFLDANLKTVMLFYESLSGKSVNIASTTPALHVYLHSQTELTRGEAMFALEALLNLNHMKLISEGQNAVKVVPAAEQETTPNSNQPQESKPR